MPDASFISISSLHDQASRWFMRAHASILGAVPCSRGCSRCCIGPFAITTLDVELLRSGLSLLAPEVRDDIQAKARSQVATLAQAFPRLASTPFIDDWPDSELDAVAVDFGQLPCPALGADGSCRLYAYRPITCRTTGIPTEASGTVEGACSVQTAVPVVKVPQVLREEEDCLARREAVELATQQNTQVPSGEELLIAYGFLGSPRQSLNQSGKIASTSPGRL